MDGAFILGTARCGSTLVSDILNLHPDLLSLSEVFSTAASHALLPGKMTAARFWRGLAQPNPTGMLIGNPAEAPKEFLYGRVENPRHDPWRCPPLLAVALPHLTDRPDDLFDWLGTQVLRQPVQSSAAHYRDAFAALARRMGRTCWVERSGGSVVATRTLARLFPRARFVLLARDGPDTALSMRDYPATRYSIHMEHRLRRLGLDLLHPDRHYGRARFWPWLERLGSLVPQQPLLDRQPDVAMAGGFWARMIRQGVEEFLRLPEGRRMYLSYEALLREPEAQIARLGRFLTGSAPGGWVTRAARLPQPRPSRAAALPEAERRRLETACAPGTRALAALQRDHLPFQTGSRFSAKARAPSSWSSEE